MLPRDLQAPFPRAFHPFSRTPDPPITPWGPAHGHGSGGCTLRLVACPRCHIQYDVTAHEGARFACSCGTSVDNAVAPGRDAEARRCGACGASVEGAARACPYCRAGLVADATRLRLLCPECFTRNDEANRFCRTCGVEFRPQPVPIDTMALACPVCAEPLALQGIGGVRVRECARCAGLWVPGEHFDALVKKAMEAARANPTRGITAVARATEATAEGPVNYRDCPVCTQPMHRKNFGRRSGIIVDWCRDHGTWLDAQELERVATFVMSGALERAERAHAETAAAEAAAMAARATQPCTREAWILAQSTLTGESSTPGRRTTGIPGAGALVGAFLREMLKR